MSSEKKTIKLPDGWVLCTSKSNPGRKYFFNKRTGKSSWTQPQANEKCDRKQKSRKEKVNKEKLKKEEVQRAILKRKSGGNDEQGSSKKKTKTEVPTPKPKPKKLQETKPPPKTPEKKTPAKNNANHRLSQLRSRLSAEAQNESSSETSPGKNKHKISPKPELKPANEKSPVTETKCTTQSPSSDSIPSIPSPSQFLAANKIISSMKAQLPEYCDKLKPKDSFADIEHGITNQTSEYPYMKHPATPPQFSEANKLVSAIKSKLTKDSVTSYSAASERLEALRKSLSIDVMETNESQIVVLSNSISKEISSPVEGVEAMDVDCNKEVQKLSPIPVAIPAAIPTPTLPNCTKDNITSQAVFVVDTNIFIHELDIIKTMLNSNIKGFDEQPMLLVPKRVVNELDRLKDNNNCNGAIWKRARAAMNYLYESLPLPQSRIRGQPLRDANSHIYPCESPDDEILNCCLQQAERGKTVILLSNDKNLCSKAMINDIKSLGLKDLKGLLTQESDPDLYDNLKHYQASIYQLLANILENEMRAKYNNLWQHVLFKAPPWTLADVLQCLLKHWIAVFNEVFPRIEHLITDLKNALHNVDRKTPKTLTESEVTNFKELCLDISKKCQIIPEYMELAKLTVDRLTNDRVCGEDEENGEMAVIEAFESVWTVMSSYCAKLSNHLGIQHTFEDKLPSDDPLDALTTKLQFFTSQITAFALAIKGVLSNDSECIDEQLTNLEAAFRESLNLICVDSDIVNKSNLRVFCTKCRNMLQEAFTKFSQLTELIEVCKSTIGCK